MINSDFVRQTTGFQSESTRVKGIWRIIHADLPLLAGIIVLCLFGLFVLFSASDGDLIVIKRQALVMLIGLVAMLVVSQFDVHVIRRWAPSMYALGLGLLLLVLYVGIEANGAKSWIDLPGLPSFQPSEILKILVPLLMAWYLASRPLPPRLKHIFWSCLLYTSPSPRD